MKRVYVGMINNQLDFSFIEKDGYLIRKCNIDTESMIWAYNEMIAERDLLASGRKNDAMSQIQFMLEYPIAVIVGWLKSLFGNKRQTEKTSTIEAYEIVIGKMAEEIMTELEK